MKFLYEYKTKDNERREGAMAASSRDDVFRLLKAKGIRPSKVTLAPGVLNRLLSFGKRGIAIVVLAIVSIALAVALGRARAPAASHALLISERHQIYGDPSIIEEMESSAYANVFTHPGERFLANFAQPGREVLPSARCEPALVAACLTNAIVFATDDSREVVELKRIVNGIKAEMRAYIEAGSAADYVRELWNRQREEQMIYKRVLNELEDNPDSVLREERNRSLRELGLRTVPRLKKTGE